MAPTVTVLITAHTEGDDLLRSVQSALGQCEKIIIVLDAPDAVTAGVARGVDGAYPGIAVYTTGLSVAAGVCFARNLGTFKSETDLIFPMDADDTLEPGAIAALRAEWTPGSFVYGGWNEVWPRECVPHPLPAPLGSLARKHITHGRLLYHRADWQRVGGYNPRFEFGFEDWAFTLALVAAGVKGVRLNKVVYNYYQRDNGRTAKARPHHDSLLRMLRNEYPMAF